MLTLFGLLMEPLIDILVVGNEILSGRTVDRNSSAIRDMLAGKGFRVSFIGVVADDRNAIARELRQAVARSHIVIVTGGLGPTSDDMTLEAAAMGFETDIVLDSQAVHWIKERFRELDRTMTESNLKQAMIPRDAEAIHNRGGTAPGVRYSVPETVPQVEGGSDVYFLPGVPSEAHDLFAAEIMPRIMRRFKPRLPSTAVVKAVGITESELYDRVKHLPGAENALAFYPGYNGIEVRISTTEDAPASAHQLQESIISLLGDRVYATDERCIEQIVADLLVARGLTVAVAESCTGGLISDRLTDVPGSSRYFLLGAVTYSNEAKHAILGVDQELIHAHGAVSAPVAAAMAEGVRIRAGADIGISTTGIAGPGGGSRDKPVGLMFSGISLAGHTETNKLLFAGDRRINKQRMSVAVLNILRLHVMHLKT